MPRLVESKKDLKSLTQESQVQIYLGHHPFNPKHIRWAIYEVNMQDKYIFITRLNKNEIISVGFEETNTTFKEGVIVPSFRSVRTYNPDSEAYSKLNNLLRKAGL